MPVKPGDQPDPLEWMEPNLLGAARRHARRALSTYTSDDRELVELAALSVGMALEFLAKVVLFRASPLLLARPNADPDTKWHLAGRPDLASGTLSAIQTLSGDQALSLAKRLVSPLRWTQDDSKAVFKVRNAAAHIACVDEVEIERAILIMVRVIEDLLPESGTGREEFWGEHLTAVANVHLDEAAAEIARRTDAKIAGAKQALTNFVAGLSGVERTALVALLSARRLNLDDYEESRACPACGSKGWVVGSIERGEVEWNVDGHDAYPSVSRTAHPYAFYCLVCNLTLEDQDELIHIGIPDEIELAADDEPWEANEPDEDAWRDL